MGIMNNLDKAYTDLIDEVYKSYKQSILESFDRLSNDPVIDAMPPRILSQEEFINKIKTDDKFSEKWGLKIEERELSYSERSEISQVKRINWGDSSEEDLIINHTNAMNLWNVPTKLITITYNNETIESYE